MNPKHNFKQRRMARDKEEEKQKQKKEQKMSKSKLKNKEILPKTKSWYENLILWKVVTGIVILVIIVAVIQSC